MEVVHHDDDRPQQGQAREFGVEPADRARPIHPWNSPTAITGEPHSRQSRRAGSAGRPFRQMFESSCGLEPGEVEQSACHRVVVGGLEFAASRLQDEESLPVRGAGGCVEHRALAQPGLALDDRRRESSGTDEGCAQVVQPLPALVDRASLARRITVITKTWDRVLRPLVHLFARSTDPDRPLRSGRIARIFAI